ncbi:MAG: amidohydrolase [Deltaproteobacteria bacterium]|nr:amidohydrolase [Deltaproteobacteria bacterium]
MNLKYGFISVDDHVQEVPNLWADRVEKKFRDRAPRLVASKNGGEQWLLDGQVLLDGRAARAGALLVDRNEDPKRWADVPAPVFTPAERLKAMDSAGIDYSVLYPTVAGLAGEAFGRLDDSELELACVRAYNDWLIDEWAKTSERFIPQCLVPIWPVEAAIAEVKRGVGKGHRGVIFPSLPMHLRKVPHVSGPEYDPFWSACEELSVPVCLHAGASPELQTPLPPSVKPTLAAAMDAATKPVSSVFVISLYSFSRVLLRHPKLRFVLAESALSWGMLYLEWADHQFDHDGLSREGYDLNPSQMFKRQCFFNSWYDPIAPFTDYIGADHIMWSSNLPLANSTWPRTQETIDHCFKGVTAADRERVLWKNAERLYRL